MNKREIARQEKLKKDRIFIEENIEKIREMYKTLGVGEIAKELKITNGNLLKEIMTENGIKIRTHAENQKIVMNRAQVKINVGIASKKSQPKRKETNIKKYGSEVASNGVNWKDDYEKENGVRHPNQKQEFRDKMSGPNNPAKRIESREKIRLNRWVNKTEEELKEIWNKTVNTWIENLEVDNPFKSSIVQDKGRSTILKTRGVEWIGQDPEVKEKGLKTHRERMLIKVNERLNLLNLELISEFVDVKSEVKLRCKICNNEFDSVLDYVFNGYGVCRVCNSYHTSIPEKELKDFIEELVVDKNDIIYNDRKILDGKEIDIVIKSKNIGIEFDGLYYHSTGQGVTEDYHLNKTTKALEKGIKLIHIFEDEWQYKKDIVKSKIKEILGINKINVEDCIIKEIEDNEKDLFLEENHIKGKDNSDIKLGCFYNDELVSIMTFIKLNDNNWQLNRFCSSINCISEMLNYFKTNFEWKEIFTYCDRRFEFSDSYYDLGFKLEEIIKPYFWYVSGFRRTEKPETKNEYKIWDCGYFKFSLSNC